MPCYSEGMSVILILFWALVVLELLLYLLPRSRARSTAAIILVSCVALSALALYAVRPELGSGLLAIVAGYRCINLIRLVKGRMHEHYLRRSTLRSAVWLIVLQAAVAALWVVHPLRVSTQQVWLAIAVLDVWLAGMLLASTLRHLQRTRTPWLTVDELHDNHLPTLTVAIPARNETDDLEECLTSLVASNYPKLEILVLDDCSQNKRTPEIIREFAHSGVRFLQGVVPGENWLAKNQAYQQLSEAANGELILFCGVDVRFQPNSLRMLVAALNHKKKSMISIIPRNVVPPLLATHETSLLQPMRYAWELALPRKLFRRPPVLSTCWLIRREVLMNAGGFAAVSRSIVPESYFARISAVHDGYSFMQSSAKMGIISNKSLKEQQSTTIRTEYPKVHRRLEFALLLSVAELLAIIVPYILLALGLLGRLPFSFTLLSGTAVAFLTLAYTSIVTLTYRMWLTRSIFLLPFAVLADVALLNYSMIKYEFFSVIWKDRNVCIPVMHVTPHLPALADQSAQHLVASNSGQ